MQPAAIRADSVAAVSALSAAALQTEYEALSWTKSVELRLEPKGLLRNNSYNFVLGLMR